MRTLSIVGARPQFIKLAPVRRAMLENGGSRIEDVLVHTGQHYDESMSQIFFDELEIPRPDVDLSVGSGSHGAQTGKMLALIEEVICARKPDMLVVYGDTNSTLAGSLAAAKLNIPIAHIEAGLRSFDRGMPEEVNRIVADHVSDLLLAPTSTAIKNLQAEGLGKRARLCGDVMLDALLFNEKLAEAHSDIVERLSLDTEPFAIATVHRASNTDTGRLRSILAALNKIADDHCRVLFPVHPRTSARVRNDYPEWRPADRLEFCEPIGYLDMLRALGRAAVVITDSGGLQKEAFFVGTPCLTLRDETEWVETVDAGQNVLVGDDSTALIEQVAMRLAGGAERESIRSKAMGLFGEGNAAQNIVTELIEYGSASE